MSSASIPIAPGSDGVVHEVLIVGGGPAGLSAALMLGRARRDAVVIDAGEPRNAGATEAHSFFTRDGASPFDLLRIGVEQLKPYETIKVMRDSVTGAKRVDDRVWQVTTANGSTYVSHIIMFATGLKDDLDSGAPGLKELWGKAIIPCPYCHGNEFADKPTALVLAPSELASMMFGMMLLKLQAWTDPRRVTVCTNGQTIDETLLANARALGMTIKDGVVAKYEARAGPTGAPTLAALQFTDGSRLEVDVAYYAPSRTQASPLVEELGAKLHGIGMFWRRAVTDMFGTCGVTGMYVIGDAGSAGAEQIVTAANGGIHAAVHANGELLKAGIRPRVLVPVDGAK